MSILLGQEPGTRRTRQAPQRTGPAGRPGGLSRRTCWCGGRISPRPSSSSSARMPGSALPRASIFPRSPSPDSSAHPAPSFTTSSPDLSKVWSYAGHCHGPAVHLRQDQGLGEGGRGHPAGGAVQLPEDRSRTASGRWTTRWRTRPGRKSSLSPRQSRWKRSGVTRGWPASATTTGIPATSKCSTPSGASLSRAFVHTDTGGPLPRAGESVQGHGRRLDHRGGPDRNDAPGSGAAGARAGS